MDKCITNITLKNNVKMKIVAAGDHGQRIRQDIIHSDANFSHHSAHCCTFWFLAPLTSVRGYLLPCFRIPVSSTLRFLLVLYRVDGRQRDERHRSGQWQRTESVSASCDSRHTQTETISTAGQKRLRARYGRNSQSYHRQKGESSATGTAQSTTTTSTNTTTTRTTTAAAAAAATTTASNERRTNDSD